MASTSKIAVAIVVAAVAIALALYLRPIAGRYQFKIANHQIQRFDTVTGEMMFCREGRCHRYDRDGVISQLGQNIMALPPTSNAASVAQSVRLVPVDGNPFADQEGDGNVVHAELADGNVLEFPANTPEAVIDRAVREHIRAAPKSRSR